MSAHDRHLDGPSVSCDNCGCELGRHGRENYVRTCDDCYSGDLLWAPRNSCADCGARLDTQDDHHHMGSETHPLCGTCGEQAVQDARQARIEVAS
jgi:hypothetical protein